jgi:hypothetical protein
VADHSTATLFFPAMGACVDTLFYKCSLFNSEIKAEIVQHFGNRRKRGVAFFISKLLGQYFGRFNVFLLGGFLSHSSNTLVRRIFIIMMPLLTVAVS